MLDHPLKKSFADAVSQNDVNEFTLAAHFNKIDEVREFLETHKGAVDEKDSQSRTALIRAVMAGHEKVVELLLKNGASVEQRNSSGLTVLMFAAMYGHPGTVKILLEHGAAIDKKDPGRDRTALMWAASCGHKEVLKLLLENGADVFGKDAEGHSSAAIASNCHFRPSAMFLEEYAATEKERRHRQWLEDTDFSGGLKRPVRALRPLRRRP